MKAKELEEAMASALRSHARQGSISAESAFEQELCKQLICKAVQVDVETVEATSPEDPIGFDLAVGRKSRGGPAKSYKPSNIAREVSRTVYLTVLLGLFAPAATAASSIVGPIALLAALTYAAFNAISASMNYSDACVLHKAWKLARSKGTDRVSVAEIQAARNEIATEYDAPKCRNESEIEDAIRNLVGLKAIRRSGDDLVLKEKIVFLANGEIMD